jgi:hypothetical protein
VLAKPRHIEIGGISRYYDKKSTVRCRKIGDFKRQNIQCKNSERYIRKKNPDKEVLPDFL